MEPSEQQAEAPSAAETKAKLECEKLRAEIDAIRKPFYKTASFYVSLVPVVLAIAGLVFTWGSGWFDVQRTRINNEKQLVQIETEKLQRAALDQQNHVASVERELQGLQAEKWSLTNQILELTNDVIRLTNQIALLAKERSELSLAKDYFEGETRRLASAETNRLKLLEEIKQVQTERSTLSEMCQRLTITNRALIVLVASREAQLAKINSSLLMATDLARTRKLSSTQFESLVNTILLTEVEELKSYEDLVTNTALKTLTSPAWRVEPDPTNSPAANPK